MAGPRVLRLEVDDSIEYHERSTVRSDIPKIMQHPGIVSMISSEPAAEAPGDNL
jgi:hypothetical protein